MLKRTYREVGVTNITDVDNDQVSKEGRERSRWRTVWGDSVGK